MKRTGSKRTGSKMVKYRRTPSGSTKRIVLGKIFGQPVCASCGSKLQGIPKKTSSRSQRRSERKYPHLCSACAREQIRREIRGQAL